MCFLSEQKQRWNYTFWLTCKPAGTSQPGEAESRCFTLLQMKKPNLRHSPFPSRVLFMCLFIGNSHLLPVNCKLWPQEIPENGQMVGLLFSRKIALATGFSANPPFRSLWVKAAVKHYILISHNSPFFISSSLSSFPFSFPSSLPPSLYPTLFSCLRVLNCSSSVCWRGFFPLNYICTFVRDQLSVFVWVYFWIFLFFSINLCV